MRWLLCALVVVAACGNSSNANPSGGSSGVPNGSTSSSSSSGGSSGSTKKDAGADDDDATDPDGGHPPPAGPANVRIMAANISSGNNQSYEDPGTHIFEGLKPDIVMIQEFNVGDDADLTIKSYVASTFGDTYTYYREPSGNIPNGVISRFPIVASGTFDSDAPDRGFAWAKITVPGTHPLYAFSVHLLTASPSTRKAQADKLLADIQGMVLADDYVVIGGDFNTDTRTEPCLTTLQAIVDAAGSHAADNKGNENTNANRGKPYDWVLGSPNLVANQVPTVIGASTFPKGLVFDSRVYKPLTEVTPVLQSDSAAKNMQHMAVVKDFHLE
jgi:endonuclease/exonuclease/phosphatase family metal-dependent hydrolase